MTFSSNTDPSTAKPDDGEILPVTPQGDDGGFSEAGAAPIMEETAEPLKCDDSKKSMWMDFELFCKCFK